MVIKFYIVASLLLLVLTVYAVVAHNNVEQRTDLFIDPTTESEYFIDAQKLISFHYPKGAMYVTNQSPNQVGGVSFQANYKEWSKDPDSWSITVLCTPVQHDPAENEENISTIKTDPVDGAENELINEVTYIDGQRATTKTFEFGANSASRIKSVITETEYKGTLYTIGVAIFDKNNKESVEQAQKAHDLIIKSFKFL